MSTSHLVTLLAGLGIGLIWAVVQSLVSREIWGSLPTLTRIVTRLAARRLGRDAERRRRWAQEIEAELDDFGGDRGVSALTQALRILISVTLATVVNRPFSIDPRSSKAPDATMRKARRRVNAAARRLPPGHRERYAEQWLRDLEEIAAVEGPREALRWAVRIRCWHWRSVRSELRRTRKRA